MRHATQTAHRREDMSLFSSGRSQRRARRSARGPFSSLSLSFAHAVNWAARGACGCAGNARTQVLRNCLRLCFERASRTQCSGMHYGPHHYPLFRSDRQFAAGRIERFVQECTEARVDLVRRRTVRPAEPTGRSQHRRKRGTGIEYAIPDTDQFIVLQIYVSQLQRTAGGAIEPSALAETARRPDSQEKIFIRQRHDLARPRRPSAIRGPIEFPQRRIAEGFYNDDSFDAFHRPDGA